MPRERGPHDDEVGEEGDDDDDDNHFEDPEDDEPDERSYQELFEQVSRDWMDIELDHQVSKTASNLFWKIASSKMIKMFEKKRTENIGRKTPQFQQIRRNFNKTVPTISMDIGYIDKGTGELTVEHDLQQTPVKNYPPSQYKKAFEIAKVDVSFVPFHSKLLIFPNPDQNEHTYVRTYVHRTNRVPRINNIY